MDGEWQRDLILRLLLTDKLMFFHLIAGKPYTSQLSNVMKLWIKVLYKPVHKAL